MTHWFWPFLVWWDIPKVVIFISQFIRLDVWQFFRLWYIIVYPFYKFQWIFVYNMPFAITNSIIPYRLGIIPQKFPFPLLQPPNSLFLFSSIICTICRYFRLGSRSHNAYSNYFYRENYSKLIFLFCFPLSIFPINSDIILTYFYFLFFVSIEF